MGILMQVRQPLSRLEVVTQVHNALSSVSHPQLEVCSDPKDSYFSQEMPDWEFPNVAGFKWKGKANPVIYGRDLQKYWASVLEEGKPEEAAWVIRGIQDALSMFAIRADCGLSFITGVLPPEELGDMPYGSPENQVLQEIARHLSSNSTKIEKIAVTSRYKGRTSLHEVR